MLRVGLTGGLATGKSTVARELEQLGAHLLYADAEGHRLLQPSGEAFAPVVAAFGEEIVKDGRIDRRALAQIVFSDPIQLGRLNEIIHPLVFAWEERRMSDIAAQDPRAIAVVEAAILIETGSWRRFDKLILTVCPEPEQIRRAVARGGITESEARARLARQMPLENKVTYADFIIETSGTLDSTLAQTRAVWQKLRSLPQ